MLAAAVLLLFLAALCFCVVTGTEVLWALLFGALCFAGYAAYKGFRGRKLLRLMWEGVGRVKNALLVICLVGIMTGLWRACGTLPYIVSHTVSWIDARFFGLWAFLLSCLMSLLTGSSLCSASIMGVILMLLARSAGADPLLTGGAVLSGIFFGDRCSPMSSSASLVSSVTQTQLFDNIRAMLRTCILPFLLSVLGYLLLSLHSTARPVSAAVAAELGDVFVLRWPLLLPAAAIVVLSLFRLNVKLTMLISILLSGAVGAAVQHMGIADIFSVMLFGFQSETVPFMAGGGLLSVLRVIGIVSISSTYVGIFRATGLMNIATRPVRALADRLSPYPAEVLVSLPVAAVSCSQNLGILLTDQLCSDCFPSRSEAALGIENSIVLTAALVPWNVAAAAPMLLMDVGPGCLKFALFLYLLPLVNSCAAFWRFRHRT